MVVEIYGTGTHNRGAELMAYAIADHLRAVRPGVRLAVGPRFGSYEDRAKYGFRLVNDFSRKSLARVAGAVAPGMLRESVGLVLHGEVEALLDASGFAFSDQWGPDRARCLNRLLRQPARARQKVVLLPQTFGSFRRKEVAEEFRRLCDRADLVYARDPESFQAVQEMNCECRLRLCPDLTIPVPGVDPGSAPVDGPFGAVVPNVRMIDKTDSTTGREYLALLTRGIQTMKRCGVSPLMVLHDSAEDKSLLDVLFERCGELPVFASGEPRVLKGILGKAHLVIGSRYHALAGALSQGVPCIGTSWCHKYRWLFEDFGCPECVIEDMAAQDQLQCLVERMCESSTHAMIAARLKARRPDMDRRVSEMWSEVDQLLGIVQ